MPDSAHIYTLSVAKLPEETNETSVGIDCCEQFNLLASTVNTGSEFNDSFLAVDRKASVSDSFTFQITKCGSSTVLPNLGTVLDFPQDDLAVGFIYDLTQYLTYGGGNYIISKVGTFLGATINSIYAKVRVFEFAEHHAGKTFKFRSYFDKLSNINGTFIDFTGSGAYSDIRLNGRFGDWKAQTQNKVLVDYAYNTESTTVTNRNKFTLTVDPVSYLFTKRLIKMHLVAGGQHFVTDHNNNHRRYINFPVTYLSETLEQDESLIVNQSLKLDFKRSLDNEFSRHNGV